MEANRLTKAQVKWVRSLQNKKVRDELGLFVAEGEKCVNDLKGTFRLELLVTPENATQTEIEQMSSLRTPQGVIGVFHKDNHPVSEEDDGIESSGLVVALDGVQDPGNMGTILRTCDWFGVRQVYCSQDTVDCFNPKVVQATMGALARVRVQYVDMEVWLGEQKEAGRDIYGMLLDGKDMYAAGVIGNNDKAIIVMGNEGNGLSAAVRKIVTQPLYIPPYPRDAKTSESLNVSVATAVVLAEFRRIRCIQSAD